MELPKIEGFTDDEILRLFDVLRLRSWLVRALLDGEIVKVAGRRTTRRIGQLPESTPNRLRSDVAAILTNEKVCAELTRVEASEPPRPLEHDDLLAAWRKISETKRTVWRMSFGFDVEKATQAKIAAVIGRSKSLGNSVAKPLTNCAKLSGRRMASRG